MRWAKTYLKNAEILTFMEFFNLQFYIYFQLSAEGLWVIELKLEPGTYEYKYLIIN